MRRRRAADSRAEWPGGPVLSVGLLLYPWCYQVCLENFARALWVSERPSSTENDLP